MDRQIESIAVIGLGLIGASFAGAYRKAYPDAPILGVDVSQEAIDELLDRGWITQGFGPNAPELPEALNTCDLVVIATPVGSVPEYFRMLADCDYQGIITDTCSTKAQIVEEAQAILPHLDHFIPGHPMARRRAALQVRATTSSRTPTGSCALMSILRPMPSRRSMRCSRRSARAW